jgi:hypothetical protein
LQQFHLILKTTNVGKNPAQTSPPHGERSEAIHLLNTERPKTDPRPTRKPAAGKRVATPQPLLKLIKNAHKPIHFLKFIFP